jgi:hypothetical protein
MILLLTGLGYYMKSIAVEVELAALEAVCAQAIREMSTTRTVRETLALADVSVPHHLKSIARGKVRSLSRLPRVRDMRVEEVVINQLSSISHERSEVTASREFDRLKATDWTFLRESYHDLYTKAMREASLIIARRQRFAR